MEADKLEVLGEGSDEEGESVAEKIAIEEVMALEKEADEEVLVKPQEEKSLEEARPEIEQLMEDDTPAENSFSMGVEDDENEEIEGEKFSDSDDD